MRNNKLQLTTTTTTNYFNKRSRMDDRYPGEWRSLRPLIIAEHANWPRDVMAFPKWLLQHVTRRSSYTATLQRESAYRCSHPRQSGKQCISDLQSFKKRLRIFSTRCICQSFSPVSFISPLIPMILGMH